MGIWKAVVLFVRGILAELRALNRMLQDGELVTEGYHLSGELCPVTEERPNQGE